MTVHWRVRERFFIPKEQQKPFDTPLIIRTLGDVEGRDKQEALVKAKARWPLVKEFEIQSYASLAVETEEDTKRKRRKGRWER